MKNLNTLLKEADPIRLEGTASFDDLDQRRQAILAEASVAGTAGKEGRRPRLVLLTMAVLTVIAATFLSSNLRLLFIGEVHAAVKFEVRLAEDRPLPGLHEVKVSGSDRSVYLHSDVVITNGDISRADLVQGGDPSQFNVSVEFTAAGGQKMRSATEKHIGKPLAILLDGQVVMAPTIRSPISSSAVITGKFTKAEAERIVSGL